MLILYMVVAIAGLFFAGIEANAALTAQAKYNSKWYWGVFRGVTNFGFGVYFFMVAIGYVIGHPHV